MQASRGAPLASRGPTPCRKNFSRDPGPALICRAVRRTGTTEPLMLFRARMIDNAGRQFVAEAAGAVPANSPGEGGPAGAAKSQEVAAARQSFPRAAGERRSGGRKPTSKPSTGREAVSDQASLRRRA